MSHLVLTLNVSLKTSGQPIHRLWTRKIADGSTEAMEDLSHNNVEQGHSGEDNSRSGRVSLQDIVQIHSLVL